MDFLNVSVFLVSSSASPKPSTSSVRSQTNPGLVGKHDIPPFCNGSMLMSKSLVPAIASVPLVQCKTVLFWNEDHPDTIFYTLFGPCCPGEVISDMSGSWCWAPASRQLEVTILHWCCHMRTTTARFIGHISHLSVLYPHLPVYDLLKVKPLSGPYQTVVFLYVACPCSVEHKLNEAGVDIGLSCCGLCLHAWETNTKHASSKHCLEYGPWLDNEWSA